MFKKLSLFILLISYIFGQSPNAAKYVAYKETSLSSSAEVITIQQPSSGGRNIFLADAFIYCSVVCNPQIEMNGTGATTTPLTVALGSNTLQSATATAFSASNVGSGTVLAKFALTAGQNQPIDLTGLQLHGNSIANNISIRTDAITGTVRIQFRWVEQ
jgi:hypothetical protein